MVVCLYYPNVDYLSAIEQACLTTGLINCRIRLFSEELLWRETVLAEGFSGIAAAPLTALESIDLNRSIKPLVLTEHTTLEAGTLSIYEPIDAFNRAICRQADNSKAPGGSTGLHFVFSFQSRHQQSIAFEGLKGLLRRQIPSAALMDLTTISNVSGKDNEALSNWLWDGEDAVINEGCCYNLCHSPKDVGVITDSDWQEKLLNAVIRTPYPIWLWCGSEWKEIQFSYLPLVKSVSWICDHPCEIEAAMKWTEMIKSQQAGIGGYLISKISRRQPSILPLESAFDGYYESLSECVNTLVEGGRRLSAR